MHGIADTDDQNPTLGFFDRLGNSIPYGDTPDEDNEDNAGDIEGVEEYDKQTELPGVTKPE